MSQAMNRQRKTESSPIRALVFVALLGFAAHAQNILTNPSFEVWLDTIGINLPAGWVTSQITHPGTANRSTDAHTGDFAVELVSPDTAAYLTATTLVRSGASYDFAGYASTTSVLGGSFLITWLSLFGGPTGSPTVIPVYRSSSYREYARRVTAPDSAFFCVVAFGTTPGATVLIDDVTLDTTVSAIRTWYTPPIRRCQLFPAQPNPFSDVAVVNYALSLGGVATLRIYDLVGNEVRTLSDEYKPAGFYTSVWNATDNNGESLPPGIYFCRLEVGDQTLTQKIIRLGD
jgi:hypothetical protein